MPVQLKSRGLIDRIMNEVTMYGGLPMRRGDVIVLATEHLGEHAGEPFGAQYFALRGDVVDADPWSLEAAREVLG